MMKSFNNHSGSRGLTPLDHDQGHLLGGQLISEDQFLRTPYQRGARELMTTPRALAVNNAALFAPLRSAVQFREWTGEGSGFCNTIYANGQALWALWAPKRLSKYGRVQPRALNILRMCPTLNLCSLTSSSSENILKSPGVSIPASSANPAHLSASPNSLTTQRHEHHSIRVS